MLDREPEAGRRAVVEHIDGVAIEADGLGEAVDRLRDPVERIAFVRQIGVAEAREIGSDDMEAVGEPRNEIAEHVAGGREAVQQQQLRSARGACFAIEDVSAVDLGGPIMDGGHGAFSFHSGVADQDDRRAHADSVLLLLQAMELRAVRSPAPHASDPA